MNEYLSESPSLDQSRWSRLKDRLQDQLDPDEIDTWFAPLRVSLEDGHRLILVAPDEHYIHTIENNYRPAIDKAIEKLDNHKLDNHKLEVIFTVDGNDFTVDGDDESEKPAAPTPIERTTSSRFDSRYRFESFVVGSSNQFAHAAARAVAEGPSASYNPLFLYGGVGLGKTHLMQAIGHFIGDRFPKTRILYTPAEQFVNELINSIRFDRMPAFRDRYRTIDVLLIDDIQFIANKERTQEEFFHTFNTLYTSQKQIILSSDSSPRQIRALEERLRSRFEWGLIADIQPPELETKIAILCRKAELEGVELSDDVALFIAEQVKSNIRELEGLLTRVLAFGSLTGRPLSLALAKETLRDILPSDRNRVDAGDIIKFVARHYGLKVSQIKSRNNSKHIAFPRQVAMYLCKKITNLSYPDIGRNFNNKHHSTVMYSVSKIDKLRAEEPELERTLQRFCEHLS